MAEDPLVLETPEELRNLPVTPAASDDAETPYLQELTDRMDAADLLWMEGGEVAEPVASPPSGAAVPRRGQQIQFRMGGAQMGQPREVGAAEETAGRLAAGTMRGLLGVGRGLAAAPGVLEDLVGIRTPAGRLGRKQVREFERIIQTFEVDDPTFLDRAAEGLGSMLGFLAPGIGVAQTVSVLTRAAPVVARWAGAGASALLEATSESGSLAADLVSQGLATEEDAARRAARAFMQNVVLLSITNRAGIFADDLPGVRRFLLGTAMEGVQEAVQTEIARGQLFVPDTHPAAGRLVAEHGWHAEEGRVVAPFQLRDTAEAAAIGALLGGGASLATQALLEQDPHAPSTPLDAAALLQEERGELGPQDQPQQPQPEPQQPQEQEQHDAALEAAIHEQFEDLLTRPDVPADQLRGRPHHINFDHIRTQDDVKQLIAKTRQLVGDEIDIARRGTMTREAIVAQAQENIRSGAFTIDRLLDRAPGQAFNAEDIMASRILTVSLGQLLMTRIEQMDINDQSTWGPAFDAFNAWIRIAPQLYGVTAESGRGQNAFIPDATGEVQFIRELEGRIEEIQTGLTVEEFQEHMGRVKNVDEFARHARNMERPGYWAMFLEALYGIRLSGIQTHAANLMGNTLTSYWTVAEHAVAARLGTGAVATGEARAMAYGMSRAVQDVLAVWRSLEDGRLATLPARIGTSFQRRAGQLAPEELLQLNKEQPMERGPAITADNLRAAGRIGRFAVDTLHGARAVDFMGTILRTPSHALHYEDVLFKVLNYQGTIYAEAFRSGTNAGLRGQALQDHINQFVQDPPAAAQSRAQAKSLENTFQERLGEIGHLGERGLALIPPLRLFFLFYRTPVNITKWAFRAGPTGVLARSYRDAMERGGAAADLARARVAMGSTLAMAAVGAAMMGWITGRGPASPEARETLEDAGWQQYSIYAPGMQRYISYSRLDPMGMLLGFGADLGEIIKNPKTWEDTNLAEKAGMGLAALATAYSRNVTSKTWATGVRDVQNLFFPPQYLDPDQQESAVARFARKQVSGMVPAIVSQSRFAMDATQREMQGFFDSTLNKLPVLSATLRPERNIFGHIRYHGDNLLFDFISPIWATDATKGSFVERRMAELVEQWDVRFPGIPKFVTIGGKRIRLGNEQREQFAAMTAGYFDADMDAIPRGYLGPLESGLQHIIQTHDAEFPPDIATKRTDEILIEQLTREINRAKTTARKALILLDPALTQAEEDAIREKTNLPERARPRPLRDQSESESITDMLGIMR